MTQRARRPARAALALALGAGAAAGCATVAITGAAQGASYTITNVAYRTFTAPMDAVRQATGEALRRMQIDCPKPACRKKTPKGFEFLAQTRELRIKVSLAAVTPKATKVSVDAKKNMLVKDKAVALEIINQIGVSLAAP